MVWTNLKHTIKVGRTKLIPKSFDFIGFSYSVSPHVVHTHTFLVMMVILGTVASAKAYSSLAPCLMMPPYS